MALCALITLMTLTLSAFATSSIKKAPPAFPYLDGLAVFVDFKLAHYDIVYDLDAKTVKVESIIEFESLQPGRPLFDLVPEPKEVLLDDMPVRTEAIRDPDQETRLRVIDLKTSPGKYTLKIRHEISTNVVFDQRGVASGFWMSDLNDRRYLEQYLPSNLEFDQYKMKSRVRIINGNNAPHVLKTNGEITKISENDFEVVYPDFYSASSLYFHLFPEKNTAKNIQFYYPSIDGRMIPVDIYTLYTPNEFVADTKKILAELEEDYGPFPHDQLIIYGNALSGGMEYSGATSTSLKALGHELFHSYHARGLMPANGNAGWMDEAIARWRDNKYPLLEKLSFESTRMAGRSVWNRMTDRMAYTEGSAFLSWIAHRMDQKGLNFKKFLREYFEKYKYTTVTTELFRDELSKSAEMDLTPDFMKYIYGKSFTGLKGKLVSPMLKEDMYHRSYTKEELLQLTNI
jgi:hypothetical protein